LEKSFENLSVFRKAKEKAPYFQTYLQYINFLAKVSPRLAKFCKSRQEIFAHIPREKIES
jgi:hypothetical protein